MSKSAHEVFKIAGVQCDVAFADKEANLSLMERWAKQASAAGVHLLVFPECALTGYCYDSREEAMQQAESCEGPAAQRIERLCADMGLFIVYGYLEVADSELYNAANLIGPAGRIGGYRKTHLPYLGVDRFTDPGQGPYRVWDAGGLRVGMLICYDCSFPEPNRCLALAGADVIALPTNWPPGSGCTADVVPNTRALENNVYYMAINRVGTERGFDFIGHSKICEPSGANLCVAQMDNREEMLVADADCSLAREKHLVRVPDLHEIDRFRDRRPDLYGSLSEGTNVTG